MIKSWTHEKLIGRMLYYQGKCVDDRFAYGKSEDGDLERIESFKKELMRRLELTKEERCKSYKNGYDQGRFDEEFEFTYKFGRYAEEGKDGLDNPIFEKVIL